MAKITEAEIADLIVDYLRGKPGGRGVIAEFIAEIRRQVTLSAEDRRPSKTRRGEEIWEQRVRNIRSHKDSASNAIYQGRLIAIPGGYALGRLGRLAA